MSIRNCMICGKEFESNHHTKSCCSIECSETHKRNYLKDYDRRRSVVPASATCIFCGKEFKPPQKESKYCSRSCYNRRKYRGLREMPHRKCVCCLYAVGLSVGQISALVPHDKAQCFKWVKKAGILDPNRKAMGKVKGGKAAQKKHGEKLRKLLQRGRLAKEPKPIEHNIADLVMQEYRSETRHSNRMDNIWNQHPKVGVWRTVQRQKTLRLSDPRYRAMFYARKRVRNYCKQRGFNKGFSVSRMIGCSPEALRNHLQSQFRDGMTWANHGSLWHIDHKIPLASARNEHEVAPLCHWTNLQPLLASENLDKGDKIITHQPELHLSC